MTAGGKNNLIGISGKIGSGKDTVGEIIRFLWDIKNTEDGKLLTVEDFIAAPSDVDSSNPYQIKKFADKLKDIVCLLIGCTRDQLEDREFKERELGEEWWYYCNSLFFEGETKMVSYSEANDNIKNNTSWYIVKLTPRLLLQLLGTEAGREIIHPNIWVNALFAGYKPRVRKEDITTSSGNKDYFRVHTPKNSVSNWIITDCRFPNEAQAIKDRGGIVIRVNRYCYDSLEDYLVTHPNKNVSAEAVKIVSNWGLNKHGVMEQYLKPIPESKGYYEKSNHPSETALDDYEFDYVIDNEGSIDELIEKIKQLKLV